MKKYTQQFTILSNYYKLYTPSFLTTYGTTPMKLELVYLIPNV